jgi:hypothetical protein
VNRLVSPHLVLTVLSKGHYWLIPLTPEVAFLFPIEEIHIESDYLNPGLGTILYLPPLARPYWLEHKNLASISWVWGPMGWAFKMCQNRNHRVLYLVLLAHLPPGYFFWKSDLVLQGRLLCASLFSLFPFFFFPGYWVLDSTSCLLGRCSAI